jgi:Lipid A 3-O-deacylase (PagL)
MRGRVPGLVLALSAAALGAASAQAPLQLPERGRAEFSLFAGFGYGVKINRGRTEEQLLAVQPQTGIALGPRFEYLIEAHFAQYFRPDGYALGLVPLGARYFFATGSVAPYVGLGAGFCWTDLQITELDRRFNFILQGGLGVRATPRAGHAWMVEARFLHYSNAGTVLPNLGFNAVVFLAGWRFW